MADDIFRIVQLPAGLPLDNGVNGKHSGAPLISVTEERKPAAKSDPQRPPHKQCLIHTGALRRSRSKHPPSKI